MIALGAIAALASCEAAFVDERDLVDATAIADRGAVADGAAADRAPAHGDAILEEDAAAAGPIASGPFEGRGGYQGTGTATLSRRSDDLRPWVIIGRRGAGKTAFLYHRCFSGVYEHQVVIESAQVFRAVGRQIESVLDHDNP